MHAKGRGAALRRGAAWGAALSLAATAAQAQGGLAGHLQVQYQKVEQSTRLLQPDGTLRESRLERESWIQNYEVNHSTRFGDQWNLYSQLNLTDLSYVGRPEGSRTPSGTLRLVHPAFGLSGSYRPSTTTTTFGPAGLGGVGLDTLQDRAPSRLTTKNQEATLAAYLSAAKLPRLDLSWIRRHREQGAASPGETGITRSARLSYDAGPLNVRGGYGDIAREPAGSAAPQTFQRAMDGGAGLRLGGAGALSGTLQYDFSASRRGESAGPSNRTRMHAALLGGDLRRSGRSGLSLNYSYRRTEIRDHVPASLDDHEGTLLYNYAPTRSSRLAGVGGVRTLRAGSESGLQRYASFIASADGTVRPQWTGVASASHVTNWDPGRGPYSIETFHVGSRFRLAQGLELTPDAQVSVNGDSAARDSRVVSQLAAGLLVAPLRGISCRYSDRFYRAGPGLGGARAESRSTTLDLRWKPVPTLELAGSYGVTGAFPRNDPRLSTRQLNLSWIPSRGFQLTGNYSRSDQSRGGGVANQLRGREILGTRVLASLTRSTLLSLGLHQSDPHRASFARQVEATVTQSFGR